MNSKKQQKQKPDERQQKIVTILSQKGEVTREFLMKELGIKSRTLMYDLAALEKKGFVIKKSPGRPDGTLRLHKCNIYYEDMAKLTIRKWTILNILQRHKHPQNIDGIIKNYNSIIGESILCQDTIQATLDKMIQENLVIKEEENKENIYLPNHNSVVIGLKEDSLVDIFFDLSNYYQGSYYKNQLIALQKKFSSYWEQPDTSADWRPPYYTMSKHPSTISDIQNYLDKLLKYRFQTNILKFQYASSDNSDNNVNYSSFQTGKLIYSENKDKMYLLGKFKHDAKLILDIKRILFDTMEETPQKNTYYDRQEYQNMVNEMFDISTEEPESIQLQFKNNPVIYDKINRLKKNRKELATIDCNGSSIIYKDKIRGISDMANYLRQFGSDVQVLEPLKLRKKMQESAERTLNNYNTEKNKNLQWKPLESIVNSAPEFTDTGNSSALDRLYQILTILSYSTPKHTPKKLSELLNVPIEIIRNDLEIIKASDELALDSLDEDIDMSQVKKFDEKFDNTAFYIDMIGFLNTDIAGEEYNTFEESDNCMESDSLRSLYMALTKQEYQTLSRFVPKLNPPNQLPLYTIKAMNTLPFDSNTTRYLSKIDNAIRNKTTLQIRYQAQNARSSSHQNIILRL